MNGKFGEIWENSEYKKMIIGFGCSVLGWIILLLSMALPTDDNGSIGFSLVILLIWLALNVGGAALGGLCGKCFLICKKLSGWLLKVAKVFLPFWWTMLGVFFAGVPATFALAVWFIIYGYVAMLAVVIIPIRFLIVFFSNKSRRAE